MPDFFTVDRLGSLSSNSILRLGQIALEPQPGVKDQDGVDFLLEQFPKGISRHGRSYLIERILITGYIAPLLPGQTQSTEGLVWYGPALELIVEFVRRSEFAKCPSRFESLFAWETVDDAKREKASRGWGTSKIYRVATERSHRADMKMLALGSETITKAWSNARDYWSGKSSVDPSWERLLSFPVTVSNEVA
jgi:hypothetical protein